MQSRFTTNHHAWKVTPAEAREIQLALQTQVVTEDQIGPVRFIAGLDVGYEGESTTRALAAVLNFPDLELNQYAIARCESSFPYLAGLRSFRETPVILAALEESKEIPDLLLCNGHGVAHPRRFGIACHVGVLSGVPTIGVAKTTLVGVHESIPRERGRWVPLVDKDEVVGAALRTRAEVKPLFVSIGHKISLRTAIEYVMRSVTRFRQPEPIRWAHRLASSASGRLS